MASRRPGTWFTALLLVVLLIAVWNARDLPSAARFFPMVIGIPAAALTAIQLALDLRGREDRAKSELLDLGVDEGLAADQVSVGAWRAFGWFGGLILASLILGFHIAVPVFSAAYLRLIARLGWVMALVGTAAIALLVFGGFETLMGLRLPRGLMWGWW